MYRSTRAPRVFIAREAISSRECIMNQLVIIVSAMLLVTVFGCGRKAPLNEDSVERGKYLVTSVDATIVTHRRCRGPAARQSLTQSVCFPAIRRMRPIPRGRRKTPSEERARHNERYGDRLGGSLGCELRQ